LLGISGRSIQDKIRASQSAVRVGVVKIGLLDYGWSNNKIADEGEEVH